MRCKTDAFTTLLALQGKTVTRYEIHIYGRDETKAKDENYPWTVDLTAFGNFGDDYIDMERLPCATKNQIREAVAKMRKDYPNIFLSIPTQYFLKHGEFEE